ncbi:MAG: hypothetical protein ABIQ44_08185, partial [Chloroflexia bacterium]
MQAIFINRDHNTDYDTSIFADTQAEFLPAGLAYTATPARNGFSFKAKRLAGHVLGTLTLAVALLAQSGAMAEVSTTRAAASHGNLVANALPSTGAPTNSQYFASTGKTVIGDFLNVYNKYGLSRIGYPVSEETTENGTKVQYFERVRMEFHPEVTTSGYKVMLTRLGVQISQGAQFATVAPFASTTSHAYVAETKHSLSEPFLSYWKKNGGVELYGFPISEPMK